MSPHNRGSLPAFSQFLPPVAWVCRLFEILCSHPCINLALFIDWIYEQSIIASNTCDLGVGKIWLKIQEKKCRFWCSFLKIIYVYEHQDLVPCLAVLATSLTLILLWFSAFTLWSHFAIPTVIFPFHLPLLRFPRFIPRVDTCSILPFLITWRKKLACHFLILLMRLCQLCFV